MRPDSRPRLWRYINLLLTYLLNTQNEVQSSLTQYEITNCRVCS